MTTPNDESEEHPQAELHLVACREERRLDPSKDYSSRRYKL